MIAEIDYTNHRGFRSIKKIRPEEGGLHFQAGNPLHPKPQWLLFATDLEDGRLKAWAMDKIHRWTTIESRSSEIERDDISVSDVQQ